MTSLDPALISALAALIASLSSLVWAFRRDPGKRRR